jgi:hypothetical protein
LVAIIVACISGLCLLGASYIAARAGSRRATSSIVKAVDTENGRSLGQTVHGMEQTQEVIVTQLHSNSRELGKLHEKIDDHIVEAKPLLEFVREQMPKHG